MLKVTIPARWVRAFSELADNRPVENALDPPPQPAAGLWRGLPDRCQHLLDDSLVHLRNRQSAKGSAGLRQRRSPLLDVLVVFPASRVLAQETLTTLGEGH